MKTAFRTQENYATAALELARKTPAVSEKRPEHFKKVMRKNRGSIAMFSPFGLTEDGLERRNPLMVFLGDSVTAGHFENTGDMAEMFAKVDRGELGEDDAVEITDARECYAEKFRQMLIDRYEQTSVSYINSGIAGDTVLGMQKRLYRDVIRYQPDLTIINADLNWGEELGDITLYKKTLSEIVSSIKAETKSDIVLLTSNMEIPSAFSNHTCPVSMRVKAVREVAAEQDVCLADAYLVWEKYEEAGYPVGELLANGMNHPSITGHEMYAIVLMQLMEDKSIERI